MTSPRLDSPDKRMRILRAAEALFLAKGDGVTLAEIAHASGAAIGSVTHYFGAKPRLAAAVHQHIADDLTAGVEEALGRHGADCPATVAAVIRSVLAWSRRNPGRLELLTVLETVTARDTLKPTDTLRGRLAGRLARWAAPFVGAKLLRPLTGPQLVAMLLGPTFCCLLSGDHDGGLDDAETDAWVRIGTRAALAGLTAPEPEQVRPTASKPRQPVGTPGRPESSQLSFLTPDPAAAGEDEGNARSRAAWPAASDQAEDRIDAPKLNRPRRPRS